MKIVLLTYITPSGKSVCAKFLKTNSGKYIPVFMQLDEFLDKSNKIIKEQELNVDYLGKPVLDMEFEIAAHEQNRKEDLNDKNKLSHTELEK
jgi:hypothetical protein